MSFFCNIFSCCCRHKPQNQQKAQPQPQTQPNPQQTAITQNLTFGEVMRLDFRDYVVRPNEKVIYEPRKSLVYSIAIKVAGLFISLIFPFIGYTLIGLSIGLIDRVILINPSIFIENFINSINFLKSIKDYFYSGISTNPMNLPPLQPPVQFQPQQLQQQQLQQQPQQLQQQPQPLQQLQQIRV